MAGDLLPPSSNGLENHYKMYFGRLLYQRWQGVLWVDNA
jgi:hypothetical protein